MRYTGEDVHSDAYQKVTAEIGLWTAPRPNVEPETAARMGALLTLLDGSPHLQEMVGQSAGQMRLSGIEVGSTVSNLRTGMNYYFRQLGVSDAGLTDPKDHIPMLKELEADLASPNRSEDAHYLMNVSLVFLNAMTSVPERYAIVELYATLIAERFTDGILALDIGPGLMLGVSAIMNRGATNPIDLRSVMARIPGTRKAQDLTAKANALRNGPQRFKRIVGVDKHEIINSDTGKYDAALQGYATAGLRPSEYNDERYVNGLNNLMRLNESPKSGVTFHQADILQPNELAAFRERFHDLFGMITCSFVTPQMSRQDQINLHTVAQGLMHPDGIIVYNHPAYIRSKHIRPATMREVRFYGSHAAEARTSQSHVFDGLQPEEGLQAMALFEDNRFRDVQLAAGKLMLNGEAVPIGEAIRHAQI